MSRRNIYGHATSLERGRTRNRVNARRREYRRRGQSFRPPAGLTKAERYKWYKDVRKWLNYSPGHGGEKQDREYENVGLSSSKVMTPDQVDMHMKMVQARVEQEARAEGMRLGRKGREAVRRAFAERRNA